MVAQVVRRYEGEVQVIGIGSNDRRAQLDDFVERHGLSSFPNAADEDGALRARLGVVGQPTWIFIGTDGKADKVFGPLGEDGLVERLDALSD